MNGSVPVIDSYVTVLGNEFQSAGLPGMTAVDRHVVSIVGVLDVILTIVSRQICCQASVVIS